MTGRLSDKVGGTCLTVDVLVQRPSDGCVLLIQKQDGLWCLPGGFVERTDASILHAAARELCEETGLSLAPADLRLVDLVRMDDPRLQDDEFLYSAVTTVKLSSLWMLRGSPSDVCMALVEGADNGRIKDVAWMLVGVLDHLAVYPPHKAVLDAWLGR